MLISRFFSAARLSRVLAGGAAVAVAATISAFAPATAFAQPKVNYNGGSGCANFSTFSYDAASQTLTVNCTGGQTGTGPSTYSVSPSSLNVTRNTDITTVISRSGGATVAEVLTITHAAGGISGWNFNGNFTGSQNINFAAGEMSKSLTFHSGPTDGWLTFTLASVSSSVGSTASGSQTFNVQGEKVVTPQPGVRPGCTTVANFGNTFTVNAQKHVFSLKAGETGAMEFVAKPNALTDVSTSETVNTPQGGEHEITVSRCPGDFSPPAHPACRIKALYKGGVVRTTSTAFPDYYCPITPGETYFMNVRQVSIADSSVNTCPALNNCEIKVQIQGY